MGNEELGVHFEKTGRLSDAAEAYNRMRQDVTTTKHIIDCGLHLVNIYLFQADSGEPVANQTNVTNPSGRAGQVHFQINDTWWGPRGSNWDGQNQSFPFYFLITRNDKSISNTDIPQATFTAVREYRPLSSAFTEF